MRPALVLAVAAGALLFCIRAASAQELEPRSYSAAPVGTNFLIVSHTESVGQVGLDPSLPISNVTANVDTNDLIYARTFNVAGRMASITALIPWVQGEVSGNILDVPHPAVTRTGFADSAVRFVINLAGSPALTPKQFALRKPTTVVGVGETVVVPTGAYNPAQLINIGRNRFSLRTEVGLEQPFGHAFVDFSTALWLFTNNPNYLDGGKQSREPLANAQVHAGYTFRPGLWLAADGTYYTGGATSTDGGPQINRLANSRYGATFAYPFGRDFTAKLSWSHWLGGRYGSNFETVGMALQYRWFDRR